jgi:hypothetical protein
LKSHHQPLVIYHYYEKDQSYIDNFSHFIQFAYKPHLNYVIVVAGSYTVDLPKASNIEYVFTHNENFDYGGYATAIKTLGSSDSCGHFIFVNSSVRGPFLPANARLSWEQILLDLFDPSVGVAGTAISLTPSHHSIAKLYHSKYGKTALNERILSHVQTTCYVLPKDSLRFLVDSGFYDITQALSKDEVVCDYEIRLSQLLLEHGRDLKCILPEYSQPDYRKLKYEINTSSREGDSGFENSYFGRTAHPYESVFVKTSRNTFTDRYLKQLANSMLINMPAEKSISNLEIVRHYLLSCEKSISSISSAIHKKPKNFFWKKLFSN